MDSDFAELVIQMLERRIFLYKGIIFILVLTISYLLAKQ